MTDFDAGYLSHLGEEEYRYHINPDFTDDNEPTLRTNLDPDIQYCYYFVVTPEPNLHMGGDFPIAWAKTVNEIGVPEDWWSWTETGQCFYFIDQTPGIYGMIYNNFPHPQGIRSGQGPDYWPGETEDGCQLDWYSRAAWPAVFPDGWPECGHEEMVLEMVIDDWDTFQAMWDEPIQTQGRWVQ
jgi:hypothetical protein